jgi:hypothetical protein
LSSPVAAMTTSQLSRPASSSEASSQASACTHSARSTDSGSMFASSRSMSITWCLLSTSSSAMDRPTAPAPAIAMRIPQPSWGGAAAAVVTSLTVPDTAAT